MIAIQVGNEFLDLPKNAKIRYEIRNPIFDTEAIPGIYTYPQSLPWTDRNRRLLNFPELLFNRRPLATSIACKLLIDGVLWLTGKITVLPSNNKEFRISISGTAANLQEAFSKSIKDIQLGGERVLGANTADVLAHAKQTALGNSDTHDYVFFPMFNPDFYENQPDYLGIINYWNIAQQRFEVTNIVDQGRSVGGSTVRGFSNMVPFVYLVYVLKQAFYDAGYSLSGNWLGEEEIRQLVFYNNQAIDSAYTPTGKVYTPQTSIFLKNHLPEMTIAELLVALKNMFGLVYYFDQQSRSCTIKTIKEIITSKAENWTGKKISPYTGTPETFKYAFKNLAFTRDEEDAKTAYLNELDLSLYNYIGEIETIADLPATPAAYDLVAVNLNNHYWLAVPDPITSVPYWEFFGEQFAPFEIGTGTEDISTQFSSVGSSISPFALAYIAYWYGYDLVPEVNQPGYSPVFTIKPEPVKFSPRLLFYRGMQEAEYDSGTDNLPFGTHHVYTPDFSRTFSRSLSWNGEFGLYNSVWKEWLDFLKTAKVFTVSYTPDLPSLLSLDMGTPKRLIETTAVISSITGEISTRGIETAQVEMVG